MLTKLAISSFNWNIAGSIARYGAGFLINIVLARILGPEPFGLVALAMIFISIGNLIIDSGLNSGLVQKKEIDRKDIKFIFTIQIIMAFIIGGLIICFAPWIGQLYHQPAIIPVLQTLTITLFLEAASQTSTGLLKRRLAFNRIQQAQIISFLVGYLLIGLPLAYADCGVWSLVIAQLVQSILYLVFVYAAERHPLGIVFRDSGKISRFGLNILGANIANWFISNYDNTAVGWVYGTTSLGFYTRAWNLAMTPVGILVSSCQSVLFSTSSKLQDSLARLKDIFLGIFIILGLIIFPFSFCESLVASDLIRFIYGDKWNSSAPIMVVLALAMPFFALMALEGPVLNGLGKPHVEFKIQWLVVGFALIIFIFAIKSPLQAIVWSVLVVYIFRFLVLSLATFKVLHISKQNLKWMLISIITFTITITLVVYIVGQFTISLSIMIRLLIQGMAGFFAWILMFLIGWNHFLPIQVQNLVMHFIPKTWVLFIGANPKTE